MSENNTMNPGWATHVRFLEHEQVHDVCGLGSGPQTCSFLMMGAGWECAKGTGCESTILKRRANGGMNAMGDNCSGPPDFIPAPEPGDSEENDG